ncbi:Aminopeptidase [Fusarium keratoplasticum]|uniref:Aminopeptidase n=1 Tax=Fusarium keratoplasticum TaxID=1328300 RepID=A0ACC0QLP7_9HYPO|nr:Aminopeptidase [Fusarium keratoplasticum]KAI8660063.1 Aminopeptidase [Fusarium keratoplasticum]
MPVKSMAPQNGGAKVVSFETTPIMSSYLVAWAIGDFEYIESSTKRCPGGNTLPVRVYTTKGLLPQASYALEHACRVLDYFSDLFEIDYPLPKLDLIAIPEFAHGAMENWGLCTFQATALLYDEATSALDNKERVSYVIAHELAHQWFGNLVTMDWWNDLWLKEGFATWAGWLAADHFHPDWQVWDKFMCEGLQTALQLDSLRASHAIDVEIRNGPDIDEIFDDISYLKGTSLIRMLDGHLGREMFLKGVNSYLAGFAYGNTTSADLWDHLSQASGKDVASFMDAWMHQIGFPVVLVSHEMGQLQLSQERFLLTGDLSPSESGAVWWVPVNPILLGPGQEISSKSLGIQFDQKTGVEIVKINAGQAGFFRVAYAPDIFAKLLENVETLTAGEKVCLIADTTALVRAGRTSVIELLQLLSSFRSETNYFVWLQVSKALDILSSNFSDTLADELSRLTRWLVQDITPTVEWEVVPGEDHSKTKMRALIIKMAGLAGDKGTIREALQKFEEYPNNTLHSSLVLIVLSIASVHGGLSAYQRLKSLYLEPPLTSIGNRETYLRVLAMCSLPEAFDDYLGFLLTTKVQVSDLHVSANAISAQPSARKAFWDWLRENWAEVLLKFDGAWPSLDKFLRQGLGGLSGNSSEEEVRNFFSDKNYETIGFGRGMDVVMERIRNCLFGQPSSMTNTDITTVISEEVAPALGPYSHAVKDGGFAFLSGNIPVDATGQVVPGGAAEQTKQVCQNMMSVLKAVGTEVGRVVKVNIFLADMGDFGAVNEVYAKYFVHKPARSCVAVKELPKKVLVEVECIAAL